MTRCNVKGDAHSDKPIVWLNKTNQSMKKLKRNPITTATIEPRKATCPVSNAKKRKLGTGWWSQWKVRYSFQELVETKTGAKMKLNSWLIFGAWPCVGGERTPLYEKRTAGWRRITSWCVLISSVHEQLHNTEQTNQELAGLRLRWMRENQRGIVNNWM